MGAVSARTRETLGMVVVSGLADQLDGMLEVSGPPGTVFGLRFPLRASDQDGGTAAAGEGPAVAGAHA